MKIPRESSIGDDPELPFRWIESYSPRSVASFLDRYEPAVVVAALAEVESTFAAHVIERFSEDRRYSFVQALLFIPAVDREAVKLLSSALRIQFEWETSRSAERLGESGIEKCAELFNWMNPDCREPLIGMLEKDLPDQANELRKRLVLFDDVVLLSKRDIRRVIEELDRRELVLALVDARPSTKDAFDSQLSTNARKDILDDMAYLGPVRRVDVYDARNRIAAVIRGLDASGEIVIRQAEDVLNDIPSNEDGGAHE